MNSFGTFLKFSTFGESHGDAIGVVIDNYPAGIKIDYEYINLLLKRRQGGGAFSTPRKEADEIKVLSGVFNDISTGMPICVIVENNNKRSKDYKELFRPAHADFSYFAKYENSDFRGGGRSSARESVARVIAGGFADLILREFDIRTYASILSVGEVGISEFKNDESEYQNALNKKINTLANEDLIANEIIKAKNENDSIGSSVSVAAFGVMAGLGEVLYDKFDAKIASAFMGLNAVKAVEIGLGKDLAKARGSVANDEFLGVQKRNDLLFLNTKNNFSGGIIGGISTGEPIFIKVHFKPTPSIFKEQKMLTKDLKIVKDSLIGRHDPCVGVRACVVLKSMLSFIIADFLMLNACSKIQNLRKIYKGE